MDLKQRDIFTEVLSYLTIEQLYSLLSCFDLEKGYEKKPGQMTAQVFKATMISRVASHVMELEKDRADLEELRRAIAKVIPHSGLTGQRAVICKGSSRAS